MWRTVYVVTVLLLTMSSRVTECKADTTSVPYQFSGVVTAVAAPVSPQFSVGEIVSGQMSIAPSRSGFDFEVYSISNFSANFGGQYPMTAAGGALEIDYYGYLSLLKLDIIDTYASLSGPTVLGHRPDYFSFWLLYSGGLASTDLTSQFIVGSAQDQSNLRFDGNDSLEVKFKLTDFSAVPEPSTLALLTLGSIGLLTVRRCNPLRFRRCRTILCFAVAISFLAVASITSAEVLYQHQGSNDPVSEGWIHDETPSGADFGLNPITNDAGTGLDAWSVSSAGNTQYPDSISAYFVFPTLEQRNQAVAFGWIFSTNVRVTQTGNNAWLEFNVLMNDTHISPLERTGAYSVRISDQSSELTVSIEKYNVYSSVITASVPGDKNAYHLYQLAYDPAAKSADLLVDGIPLITDFAGSGSTSPWIVFSNHVNFQDSSIQSNYNLVQFSIVPEPSTLALLCIGLVGLLARRRMPYSTVPQVSNRMHVAGSGTAD